MKLKEKDFIEVDFTGRIKGGEVFDSTLKKELEKLHEGHDHKVVAKPLIFCIGKGMFLKAIDEFLVGKETGKSYKIELEPEKAFGKRQTELIQTIPIKIFKEKDINPVPGFTLNFDGKPGKILTVSGGRVIVDFNHMLAGKDVVYDIKINRKVEDINEKIKALNDFFFRKEFKFKIEGKKLVMEVDKPLLRFVEMFKDQFKDILGLELEIKELEEKNKS